MLNSSDTAILDEMFMKNKYYKIYTDLVNDRKSKALIDGQYYENHHIIPSCFGGSDEESNKVYLTAREHFTAHWLLIKMAKPKAKYRTVAALNSFCRSATKKKMHRTLTPRQFDVIRNAWASTSFDEKHRKNLSIALTGENNHRYGKPAVNRGKKASDETRKKQSDAHMGKPKPWLVGVPMKDETKQLLSNLNKGKPRVKPHEIVKCPHCDKEGIKPNMKRWHFDNCKELIG